MKLIAIISILVVVCSATKRPHGRTTPSQTVNTEVGTQSVLPTEGTTFPPTEGTTEASQYKLKFYCRDEGFFNGHCFPCFGKHLHCKPGKPTFDSHTECKQTCRRYGPPHTHPPKGTTEVPKDDATTQGNDQSENTPQSFLSKIWNFSPSSSWSFKFQKVWA